MCQSLQLKPGEAMKTQDAVLQAIGGRAYYAGFANADRMEGNDWYWKQYEILEVVRVPIHGFGERNSKAEPRLKKHEWKASERQVERKDDIVVIICKTDPVHNDKGNTARIVTRPATEDVFELHDREPLLWNRDQEIWKEIFGGLPDAA